MDRRRGQLALFHRGYEIVSRITNHVRDDIRVYDRRDAAPLFRCKTVEQAVTWIDQHKGDNHGDRL